MEWSFGLSANEIMATALGFAVQDQFFQNIATDRNYLHDVALAFGLIGFALIGLSLGRIRFSSVIAWAILFLIVIVRPLGEPVFFTTLDDRSAPVIHQTPAIGGTLTQEEFAAAYGNVEGMETYCDRMKAAGLECLRAFTPQLAIVSALNNLNVGLAKEYLPPGRRLLAGYQPAISTLTAGRLASNASNFHLSQYLQACTGEGSGAAERLAAAYVPYGQLERQGSQDVIEALQAKQISALDAWRLLLTYDAYAQGRQNQPDGELILPPLICPPEGCAGRGRVRAMDRDVHNFVLKEITARSGEDFTRVRDTRREIIWNARQYMNRLNDIEGIERRLREQPVALAMPLNAHAIAAGIRYESAASGAAEGWNVGAALDRAADYTAAGGGGCVAGAMAGGAVGAGFGGIGAGPGALVGCGIGALVGTGTRAAVGQNLLFRSVFEVRIGSVGEGSARRVGDNTERVYVIENCADFHRLTDARLFVDTGLANRLTETLAGLLASRDLPADFGQMSLEQQAIVGLQSALASQLAQCADVARTGTARRACEETAGRNIGELLAYAQTMAANNALPELMAAAHAESARAVRFPSKAHEMIAAAGGVVAPVGLAFKASVGGFAAGTYAEIMPVIVTFGTALTIMFTPFLFLIGLAVPHWSLNVLLLPLIGVAYFQLVKIVFTIINIFGKTFIEANELNLLTGTGQQFPTIVLGYAYTAAFILSAGLLYALRNPAAIVQTIAGKADRAAQIGWQEFVGAYLLGQKGMSAIGQATSAESIGQAKGAFSNINAGRNTYGDRIKAAELSTINKGEETTMNAQKGRLTTPDTRDQLQARAAHQHSEDVKKRAAEEASGRGLSAKYRQPRGVKLEEPNAPFMALAQLYADNGGDLRRGATLANQMLSSGAASVVEIGGDRYFQFHPEKIAQMQNREIAKLFDRLKDRLQNDHIANQSNILKDTKI